MVVSQTCLQGRVGGCLRSGGKPTRLSTPNGVAVLVSQTCLQGQVGVWDVWVGGERFGVHW